VATRENQPVNCTGCCWNVCRWTHQQHCLLSVVSRRGL